MYNIGDFTLGAEVSFSIHGTIGGANTFSGEVVSAIGGAHIPPNANGFTNHSNIYPALPDEVRAVTDDSYNSYNYVALSTGAADLVYIGIPWIADSTLQTVNETTKSVTVKDPFNDSLRLSQVLKTNGYEVTAVE